MRTPKTSSAAAQTAAVSDRTRLKRKMDTANTNKNCSSSTGSSTGDEEGRKALSDVVSECVQRWFQDALNEAKGGDVAMQVLVGQMYFHGYGGAKDLHKANYWMTKASRVRSSVWNVSHKRPGYHASDSDSKSEGNL